MPKKKLNSLFKKTEPEPETLAPASVSAVSDAAAAADPAEPFEPVPLPGFEDVEPPKEKKRIKPQGVYVSEIDMKYIQKIADEYGETRHGVMQYAIKELIRQYRRGKKLRTNILGKLDK